MTLEEIQKAIDDRIEELERGIHDLSKRFPESRYDELFKLNKLKALMNYL
jgi:hypothetical protein